MTKRTDWSVALEFAGNPEESELDALLEALDPHAGIVGGGTVGRTFGVRLSVGASGARDAAENGEAIVRRASSRIGFEPGEVVALEIQTLDEQIASNRGVGVNELVGLADIAKEHGFSRQRAHELSRLPGFPEPIASLTAGRVWRLVDVERFLATPRRPGRPRIQRAIETPRVVAESAQAYGSIRRGGNADSGVGVVAMAGRQREVAPRKGPSKGWTGNSGKTDHRTQAAAIRATKSELAKSGGGELVIKGRDGKIRDKNTVPPGRDPRKSKG